MYKKLSQSRILCALNTFSLYALRFLESTEARLNLQSLERILQMLKIDTRCAYA